MVLWKALAFSPHSWKAESWAWGYCGNTAASTGTDNSYRREGKQQAAWNAFGSGKELGSSASPGSLKERQAGSAHASSSPRTEGSPTAQRGFPRSAAAAGRRIAHIISSVFHAGSIQLGVWPNRSYCLPSVSKVLTTRPPCYPRSVRKGLLRSCGAVGTPGWKWRGVTAVAAQAALPGS